MLTLFANGFSPFARKVAMALEYKRLSHETVDALSHGNRERLLQVNPRAEVPVLVDDDILPRSKISSAPDLSKRPQGASRGARTRATRRHADRRNLAQLLDLDLGGATGSTASRATGSWSTGFKWIVRAY